MYPAKNIYLKTSPEKCLQRIGNRGRIAEGGINIEWLERYQGYYERALFREGEEPLVIEGDSTDALERSAWIDKILEVCEGILDTPTGYTTDGDARDNRKNQESCERKDNSPVRGDAIIPGEIRYESRILEVGAVGDSFQKLKEKVIGNWPELSGEEIEMTWKEVKCGPYLSITTEDEFREALNTMGIQGRPVARFILSVRSNKNRYEGTDGPDDS
jgi:hypothetical protein